MELYQKKGEDKLEAGTVNRLNKAQKWTEFAVNTASSGLGLAERGKAIVGGDKKKNICVDSTRKRL